MNLFMRSVAPYDVYGYSNAGRPIGIHFVDFEPVHLTN